MKAKRLIAVGIIAVVFVLSFNVAAVGAAPAQQMQMPMPMPGEFYQVKPGDTMYSIARWFGTTVWEIAQANGIVNPSRIYSGQALFIPAPGPIPPCPPCPEPPLPPVPPGPQPPMPPLPPEPQPPMPPQPISGGYVMHMVRYGENLYGIAQMYGVTAWAIAQANGLVNPNYIYAGQTLLIPLGGPMPGQMPTPVVNPGYPGQWGGMSWSQSQYSFSGGSYSMNVGTPIGGPYAMTGGTPIGGSYPMPGTMPVSY